MKAKPASHPGEVVLELSQRDEALLAAASSETKPSPFQLKRILVPIDFSDCSKKALQYAIPLAQQHAAAITLLYVIPSLYEGGEYRHFNYDSFAADMRTRSNRELAKLAVDQIRGDVSVDTIVRTGSAPLEIIELAKSLPADVIVIATHGHTGLKHVFLGSVAEYVVRRAPCPVLVVREPEHEFLATGATGAQV